MLAGSVLAAPAKPMTKPLVGNIPSAIKEATPLGLRLDPQVEIDIALTLPIRNKADLDDYDAHLFNPADPLYHKYLTIQEMIDRYSPTQADYDAVVAFAASQGLTVTHTSANRMLIDVSGPASTVENAFGVHLMKFQDKNGRVFHAPDREPSVPTAVAARLLGIIGMDDDAVVAPQLSRGKTLSLKVRQATGANPMLQQPVGPGDPGDGGGGTTTAPTPVFSSNVTKASGAAVNSHLAGVNGVLRPSDIKTAYNLNSVPSNGQGQILDIVALNGFIPGDITTYEDNFGLPHVPIQIISVDGVSNIVNNPKSDGSAETALDIEMAVAVAPGLSLIRVYEGPQSSQGVLDILNKIGSLKAYQTSCSWASNENNLSSSFKQSEGNDLQYMITTANCFFAAAGDWGPYDDSVSDRVTALDPASQGWACAVGGTTLVTDQYSNYVSESTWNVPATSYNAFLATGGGISGFWPIRNQKAAITSASGGSTTRRNLPDVSLNAYGDYLVYCSGNGGGWALYEGTSLGTPIWASFLALVNSRLNGTSYQQVAPLADFTSTLYSIAQGPRYGVDFHDIADGSNNRKYSGGAGNQAVVGYDLATGLGSFNGANLFNDLIVAAGGKP